MDMNTKHILLALGSFGAGWISRGVFQAKPAPAPQPVVADLPFPSPQQQAATPLTPRPLDEKDYVQQVSTFVSSLGGVISDSVRPEVLTTKGQRADPFDAEAFTKHLATVV